MINKYLEEIKNKKYPSQKEWFYKYGKHGHDYQKLLTYKKSKLLKLDLPTTEGSLYFNAEYIYPIMKEYYQTQDIGIESINQFSETFEEILIFSEVEGTLEIEGIKTSSKKIEKTLKKDKLDEKEQIIQNMKNLMTSIQGIILFQKIQQKNKRIRKYIRKQLLVIFQK